jgi:hypothetical protein
VVLIPARRFEALRGSIPLSAVMQSCDRALKLMESLSPIFQSAKRCFTSLQLLNQEIVGDLPPLPQQQSSSASGEADAMPDVVTPQTFRFNVYNGNSSTWEQSEAACPLTAVDGVFEQMPLDFSWIDSLPVDLSVDEDIIARYNGSA